MNEISKLTTLDGVRDLWTINGKRPSATTIWRYRKEGLVPKPIAHGSRNLFEVEKVIEYRDRYFQNKLTSLTY